MINGALFRGELPGVDDRILPENHASNAVNCEFKYGTLRPFQALEPVAANLTGSPTQSIYLYEDQFWFSWGSYTTFFKSPIEDDQFRRIYFADSSGPRVTSNLIATGAASMPAASYSLGVPQPSPPSVTSVDDVGATPDEPGDDITRFYVITLVTEYGEEGPPSLVSDVASLLSPLSIVTLALPGLATNTANVTAVRIYRADVTNEFFFVAEVPLAQSAFVDNVQTTGAALETTTFFAPPVEMKGLALMANGIASGFVKNKLFFSPAYLPYAYPPEYTRATEDDIVATAALRTSLVVGTKGNPYVFSGISPDAMTEDKLPLKQSCVSERSMISLGDMVIYASPDGLVGVSPVGAQLVTQIPKQAWKEFQPETIHAYHYEGKYIGFYGGVGGFVYDMQTKDFVRLDFYATAGYSDTNTDTLYLVVDGSLFAWDSATSELNYVFRSKIFDGPNRRERYLRIIGEDMNRVSVRIWVDDRLIYNRSGLSGNHVVIPPARGYKWQYELSGQVNVVQAIFTDTRRSL